MAAAAQPPVSAQVVGNAFVNQYYQILHHSPELVHRFYQEISKLGRPQGDGPLSLTTTMQDINEKILSLNYGEFRAEIKSVDAQESYDGGVHVLVTGSLAGKDNMIQNFTQTFFLAPQEKGYFVLNDMFQYVGKKYENGNPGLINEVEAPVTPQQEHSPVQENHVFEQTRSAVEVNVEPEAEAADLVQAPFVEEEVPVPEVVDDVPVTVHVEAEPNPKTEETPKKSYASIVMVMKENPIPISSPPRKPAAKIPEQVNHTQASVPATEIPVAGFEATENGNHQEGESIADGYSVYIKGLPLIATPAQLEDEFKKFGPIKYDGIQVRSNKQQGFCFGFVEFEEASAVEKAIEASPIMIGGRQAYVEEKKSTNTRGSFRGRYSSGRGSGFRNEGSRGGRGNGRGYNNNRGESNGRAEFGNRGNSRGGGGGGYTSRGGDGYQSAGGRSNRGGGMVAKTGPPRVSATA